MILSFSLPSMLPFVQAGILQANGEDVGQQRVKRQTIRRRGPLAERLLKHAENACWTIPYDLQLWWKSRTPQRAFLGTVKNIRFYPILILHSQEEYPDGRVNPVLRISGPDGWREGDAAVFDGGKGFEEEVYADGFDGVKSFREFFVPKMSDRFDGVIFKW
jgi:hypothetical protein